MPALRWSPWLLLRPVTDTFGVNSLSSIGARLAATRSERSLATTHGAAGLDAKPTVRNPCPGDGSTHQHHLALRIRHLLALGTPKRAAIRTGTSSKTYSHLSRSLGTQTGMTNDWLQGQGLISIRDQWMKAHGSPEPSCAPFL